MIAEINTVVVGSTGSIMMDLAEIARSKGHTVYTYSPRMFTWGRTASHKHIEGHIYYGSILSSFIHKVMGQLTGFNGCFSIIATRRLVRDLERKQINVLHLHNIHEFCINLPVLFDYIKRNHIKVIWTLHDCWAFTGHCPYYTMVGCSRWKNGCGNCPQKEVYPRTLIDTTRLMWNLKRKWFSGVEDMVIVTPSQWLADNVMQSFLSEYPVEVINNGIDLNVFHPTASDRIEKLIR